MKKWITIISLCVLALLLGTIKFYMNAFEPIKTAEERAVETAKKEAGITVVDEFHVYYGEEACYVVQGKDQEETQWIVWIPENKEKVIKRKASSGITKKEAIDKLLEEKKPSKIISVKLGMEKNIPLWEIQYELNENTLNYYYVDFKTGEWLKKIENL